MPEDGSVIVFHAGALGDSVLLWPMLRSLAAAGRRTTLVTHDSKGRLAARMLGVAWESIENACWRSLWGQAQAADALFEEKERAYEVRAGVARVISFVADGPHGAWARNAAAMFPNAEIEILAGPLDRRLAIELAEREGGLGLQLPVRSNPGGSIVMHVGAGSEAKRWSMENWESLAGQIGDRVHIIAGEVEGERFSRAERATFDRLRGRYLDDLDALADELLVARVFVGCDSGPAHLAAQLGVPTVAVFTATDPKAWAPIGPAVRVAGAPGTEAGVPQVLGMIGA